MNDGPLIHEEPLFELEVDDVAGSYFKETARWTSFISILYFIIVGLLVFCLLIITVFMKGAASRGLGTSIFGKQELDTATTLIITVLFLLIIGLLLTLSLMLYRFASLIRKGLERQDQVTFNAGLRSLKNYFVFYGIIAVINIITSFFKFF